MKRTLVRVFGVVFVIFAIPFYWLSVILSPAQTAIATLVLAIALTWVGIYLLIHPGVILFKKRTTSNQPPKISSSSGD